MTNGKRGAAGDSEAAELLRAVLRDYGLTQGEVAKQLGGISTRMLRHVLSGAKPGNAYLPALRELNARGRVTHPPERRKNKAGRPVPVRAKRGAPQKSVPPPAPRPRAERGKFGVTVVHLPEGRALTTVTAPKTEGAGREQGRRAVLNEVEEARAARQRVRFTLVYGNGTEIQLGGTAGYDPARASRAIIGEGADSYGWLDAQAIGSKYSDQADGGIIAVTVQRY